MSQRLNQEREKLLAPQRIQFAKEQLVAAGFEITNETELMLQFKHKAQTITLFPYSGWFTGKTVTDGRGLKELMKQLK